MSYNSKGRIGVGVQAAANGHRAPVSGASASVPAASAAAVSAPQAASAAAPTPAVPAADPSSAAAGPASTAMAIDPSAPAADADAQGPSKRQADALMEEPSSKRSKTEASGAESGLPAAAAVQDKPDWSEEPSTVAKFVFQQADKFPQASSLQMLRDSFGGPKAGVKNLDYKMVRRHLSHSSCSSSAAVHLAFIHKAS